MLYVYGSMLQGARLLCVGCNVFMQMAKCITLIQVEQSIRHVLEHGAE